MSFPPYVPARPENSNSQPEMEDDIEVDIVTLDEGEESSPMEHAPSSSSAAPPAAPARQDQQEMKDVVIKTEPSKPKQKFNKVWSADEITALKKMWRTQGPEPWAAFCDALRERGVNKSNRQIMNQAEQLKLIPEEISPLPGTEPTDLEQTESLAQNEKIAALLQPAGKTRPAVAPVPATPTASVAANASTDTLAESTLPASTVHFWTEEEDQLLRDLLERNKSNGQQLSRAALAREAISQGIRRTNLAVERRLRTHDESQAPVENSNHLNHSKRARLSLPASPADDVSGGGGSQSGSVSHDHSAMTVRPDGGAGVAVPSSEGPRVNVDAIRRFVQLLKKAAPASIDPATRAAGRECGWEFVPVDDEMQVPVEEHNGHVWLLSNMDPSSNTAEHAEEGFDFFRTHEALAAFLQQHYNV